MASVIWFVIIFFAIIPAIKKARSQQAQAEERQRQNRRSEYMQQFTEQPKKKSAKNTEKKTRTTEDLRKTSSLRDTDQLRDVNDLRDTSSLRKSEHECDVHSEAHKEVDHINHVNPIDVDSSELMDKVYEAMVCGPELKLPSDRDFVAEGLDMINSYVG